MIFRLTPFILFLAGTGAYAQAPFQLQQGMNGYSGCYDAHILANKPDWNTGGEDGLEVTGNGGEADAKHGLIRFDLSSLPVEVRIDSVWLELYLVKRRTPQSAPKSLGVFRINKPWDEGSGNDLAGYDGRPVATGECSWQYASYPGQPWAKSGAEGVPADRLGIPEDVLTISPSDSLGKWYSWNITGIVRFGLSHPDSNFGILLRELSVSPATGILNFASGEYATESSRPKLTLWQSNLPATVAGTLIVSNTATSILTRLPYSGDANNNGYAEAALARAGDAQWSNKVAMTRNSFYYEHAFFGLTQGLYHVRVWLYDPDGVQGAAVQTKANIELTPESIKIGELFTSLSSRNEVNVNLTFYHDSNSNAIAWLQHKRTDSTLWLDDGEMIRLPDYFEKVLTGLTNGQRYDIQVTAHDPDGVEGDSIRSTQIYLPLSTEKVRILDAGQKSFTVESGNYIVTFDSAGTANSLWLYPNNWFKGALSSTIVTGLDFNPFDPTKIANLQVADEQALITVLLTGVNEGLEYSITLDFFKTHPGLLRWRCQLQNAAAFAVKSGQPEIRYYDRELHREVSSTVEIYAEQQPYAAGIAYGYDPFAAKGTILYFANFTSLNDYFALQHVGPERCVSMSSAMLGFQRPSGNRPLRNAPTFIIADAFIYLQVNKPPTEAEQAGRFLTQLATIYQYLQKPQPEVHDWHSVALKLLDNLKDERCLVTVSSNQYLRTYVDVPRLNTAEAITQLDVIEGIRRFERVFGNVSDLDDHLANNLYNFYNLTHRTLVNDMPNEGVQTGDSWYAIHLHLGLASLAKMGDEVARTLFFLSLPELMEFAKAVDYQFPVFFNYGDNSAISGQEPDATGGYLYLMLDAYNLSRDSKYLDEAKLAAEQISGYGFNFLYETHITAATCAGLARLYHLTDDSRYLEKSYMPLANILLVAWLWECDYGYAQHYSTFFGLSPMTGAGVITMMEQHHALTYLREYMQLVGSKFSPEIVTMLDDFDSYARMVLRYSLPPFLVPEALHTGPTVYNSHNIASFNIPLEDLRDGWQKSGSLGQQIYGAGGPFVLAADIANGIEDETRQGDLPNDFLVLQNYPNPFNAATIFHYQVTTTTAPVRLEIYNVLGRMVKTLVDEGQDFGEKKISWDGTDCQNLPVSSGVYVARLRIGEEEVVRKVLLLQ